MIRVCDFTGDDVISKTSAVVFKRRSDFSCDCVQEVAAFLVESIDLSKGEDFFN